MRILAPTKQKIFTKRIFGFDIETCNDNKDFVMASIVGNDYKKFFYSKEEIIQEVKTNFIFRNSCIFATNLSFDFFGIYFNKPNFFTMFRSADLIYAKTWMYKGEFYPKSKHGEQSLKSIMFIDSLNYAKMSVKDMGEIIGINKLEHPSFLGEMPKSDDEWDIMRKYNFQDSYITFKFMQFLIDSFEELGATFKNTLASTSMSLFKNIYLKNKFFGQREDYLEEQFESYFGGRTEAFSRGTLDEYNYYDFNSLYPSVMLENVYPNPNTIRIVHENSLKYINAYEGISQIKIFIPKIKYPILPYRLKNGRVVFPCGTFKGWYTHIEIKDAIKYGAIVMKVFKTHYFTEVCKPFENFVSDLFNKRKKYKTDKNKMEYVIKICLNSLYGKFGQKYKDKDNWIHESMFDSEIINKISSFERKGQYIRITEDMKPSAFCIPIWASYVTAYGRIKLHNAIIKYNPVYVDTDSLLTKSYVNDSNVLGELKLEMKIKKGIIVRPKFYALYDSNNEEHIKIKGLGKRLNYIEFMGLKENPRIDYTKFSKFKEAVRRDFVPNEIIKTHKEFSLEDEKRVWKNKYSPFLFEESETLEISEGVEK